MGFWGDYNTHHIFSPHLPTSYSFLINMQWAHWYSNCVLCCDLMNGIWLLAWFLEMGLVFLNSKDGRSGRKKGPWEAKNVWRAEASPCQLDCRSLISLQHLRMSVSVITATSSHRRRGSGRNEYPFMKKSQTRMVTRAVWGFFWKPNPLTCMTSWLSWGAKWKTVKCKIKSLHSFQSNTISRQRRVFVDYVAFFYSVKLAISTCNLLKW